MRARSFLLMFWSGGNSRATRHARSRVVSNRINLLLSTFSFAMGVLDHIKRATGGSTPERPTGSSGNRLSVSSDTSNGGRDRSGSLSNLIGGGTDKRKSVEVQEGDDAEVLDESEGNVLLSLISQRKCSGSEEEGEGEGRGQRSIYPVTHTLLGLSLLSGMQSG
jgi:hypothetical protein